MKKAISLLALCAVFSGSAFADEQKYYDKKNPPPCKNQQEFAWGTTLAALAVIGVVVGLTASQASSN